MCETPDAVQVHYVITTTAEKPENSDLSGKFHINIDMAEYRRQMEACLQYGQKCAGAVSSLFREKSCQTIDKG